MPLRPTCSGESKSTDHRDTYVPMSVTAQFTTAKPWDQLGIQQWGEGKRICGTHSKKMKVVFRKMDATYCHYIKRVKSVSVIHGPWILYLIIIYVT